MSVPLTERLEAALERIGDRGATYRCPACAPGFPVGVPPKLVPLANTVDVPIGLQMIECLAFVCPNCGYLRHHSLGIIEAEGETTFAAGEGLDVR